MSSVGGVNILNKVSFVENKAQKKQIFETLQKYREEVTKIRQDLASIGGMTLNTESIKDAQKEALKLKEILAEAKVGGGATKPNTPRQPPASNPATARQRMDDKIERFRISQLHKVSEAQRQIIVRQLKQIDNERELGLQIARERQLIQQNIAQRNRELRLQQQQNFAQKRLNGSVSQMAGGMFSVFTVMTGIAAIARTGMELQGIESTMLAVSANAGAAKENMKFVREEARRLGGDLKQSSKAFSQLLANRGALDTDQIKSLFSATMEASVVLGQSTDDTAGSIRALVQMLGKGQVMSEELKQQLSERMPVALKVFAKAAKRAGISTNGTTAELFDLMEKGQVAAEKILPAVTEEFKIFANTNGALEKSLARFSVKLGQATLDLQEMQEALFDQGVEDGLVFLIQSFQSLAKSTKTLAAILGGTFKGAVTGLIFPFRLIYSIIYDLVNLITGDLSDGTKKSTQEWIEFGSAILGFGVGLYVAYKGIRKLLSGLKALKGAKKILDKGGMKGAADKILGSGKDSGFGGLREPVKVFVVNKGFGTGVDGGTSGGDGSRRNRFRLPSMKSLGALALGVAAAGNLIYSETSNQDTSFKDIATGLAKAVGAFASMEFAASSLISDGLYGLFKEYVFDAEAFRKNNEALTNINAKYAIPPQGAAQRAPATANSQPNTVTETKKVEVEIKMADDAASMFDVKSKSKQTVYNDQQSVYDN